jgi:hypothetical protein
MSAGGYWKTNNHTITAYWPDQGQSRNFSTWGSVGTWVSQNEKVLNKKSETQVCQLVAEQFPSVELVECRDFSGRAARLAK